MAIYIPIQGCKFHFCQAWNKKIQKLGHSKAKNGKKIKQETDPKVTQFIDYLFFNCIEDDAKFFPNMWEKTDASLENTTNASESFHVHFNKCIPTYMISLRFWNSSKQSHIKMASMDQLKVNYSKTDVQRQKNLDGMIKKILNRYSPSMGMVKFACFQASCQ